MTSGVQRVKRRASSIPVPQRRDARGLRQEETLLTRERWRKTVTVSVWGFESDESDCWCSHDFVPFSWGFTCSLNIYRETCVCVCGMLFFLNVMLFFLNVMLVFFKWEWRLLVDEQQCVAVVSPEQKRDKYSQVRNTVLGFCYSRDAISYCFVSVIK